MPAKIYSATLNGLGAKIIEVEVDVSNGLPGTTIVGLADTSIKESKERVRSCLRNSEYFQYPLARISINLAPANIFKYGTQFDLAITLGILQASQQIDFDPTKKLFLGEISLQGQLRQVRGVLPFVLAAKQAGFKEIFLPRANIAEAMLVADSQIKFIGLDSLEDFVKYLNNDLSDQPESQEDKIKFLNQNCPDFSEIAEQHFAKRGLEIAAAGGHNVLFKGPPGSGKTLMAEALASILPDLSKEKLIEVVRIYSTTGMVADGIPLKPFRNPHHRVTLPAFIGGGTVPMPGEITLAHNGILFLDEFPEFPRAVLEALRQPLESGTIKISRLNRSYVYPADFILIASQNPCPCGFFGDDKNICTCRAWQIQQYARKISGPILDRIDLQIMVRRVDIKKLDNIQAESSEQVRSRVNCARQVQYKRFGSQRLNSRADASEIKKYFKLDQPSRELIYAAENKYHFSSRSYFRIIKIARTIADLANSPEIGREHIAESLQYRL